MSSSLPSSDSAARVVAMALDQGPVSDFEDLLLRCRGLYPADVLAALAELRVSGRSVPFRNHFGAYADLRPLEPPHPLDFDWRFDEETARQLWNRALAFTSQGDAAVALGTPTVYLAAIADPRERRVFLHDRNTSAHRLSAPIEQPRPASTDISIDSPPRLGARYVVADPPWYPEFMETFLWWATQICGDNAIVQIAHAPPNTRPTALHEREQLVEYGAQVGLALERVEEDVLRYETPPFERLALQASGLPEIPAWRTGDLLTFRSSPHRSTVRPELALEAWRSVRLGRTQLRFRAGPDNVVDPRLFSILDGDVLDSVSRRDPRRSRVKVWTTLNRVFDCAAPGLAYALAASVAEASPALEASTEYLGRVPRSRELVLIEEAIAQLGELAKLESAAIAEYAPRGGS